VTAIVSSGENDNYSYHTFSDYLDSDLLLALAKFHEHRFDVPCPQLDPLLSTERPEGIRQLAVIPVAIVTGQLLPWVGIFDAPGLWEGQRDLGFGPSALTGNGMGFLLPLGVFQSLLDLPGQLYFGGFAAFPLRDPVTDAERGRFG